MAGDPPVSPTASAGHGTGPGQLNLAVATPWAASGAWPGLGPPHGHLCTDTSRPGKRGCQASHHLSREGGQCLRPRSQESIWGMVTGQTSGQNSQNPMYQGYSMRLQGIFSCSFSMPFIERRPSHRGRPRRQRQASLVRFLSRKPWVLRLLSGTEVQPEQWLRATGFTSQPAPCPQTTGAHPISSSRRERGGQCSAWRALGTFSSKLCHFVGINYTEFYNRNPIVCNAKLL